MILMSFGTRPEYIKIKPLIEAFEGRLPFKLLFTGQHVDLLSNVEDQDVIRLEIKDGPNRLDSIVSSVMNQNHIFEGIDAVLVQGDTTSAFAIALAAFHRKLKIIHLEAGLRTYDLHNPYPEEFNRQAVSRVSNIHLCPTMDSAHNLSRELVKGRTYVVGNTVLDNLVDLETSKTNTVIITMHRRENHDKIAEWFEAFDNLAKTYHGEYRFILPIHPNPNVQKHRGLLKYVEVIDPLPYDEFLNLLASCSYVISDSGGLQEETAFLGKRSIVCRKVTERPEGLGSFSVLCETPLELFEHFYVMKQKPDPTEACPYGDGKSAQRIVSILEEELS
jgi:UDP-N-acetylglucosamine 2-epimerase (non-hydrolysing)